MDIRLITGNSVRENSSGDYGNIGLDLEHPASSTSDGMFSMSEVDEETDTDDDGLVSNILNTIGRNAFSRQYHKESNTRGGERSMCENDNQIGQQETSILRKRRRRSICSLACVTCANHYLTDVAIHSVDAALSDHQTWQQQWEARRSSNVKPLPKAQCFFHSESFEL